MLKFFLRKLMKNVCLFLNVQCHCALESVQTQQPCNYYRMHPHCREELGYRPAAKCYDNLTISNL